MIFNHLLIHGSANNVSARGRMAMLLQVRMNFLKKITELKRDKIQN